MRRVLLLTAVVAAVVVAAVTGDPTLLTVLPVLALFALLGSGTYVGEERAVARLRRRPTPRRRPAGPVAPRPTALRRPRGGRLVACGLARRGPPSLVAAA